MSVGPLGRDELGGTFQGEYGDVTEQGALFGITVPPDVKLTERQWFALETIASAPVTSERLGLGLHRRRGCRFCTDGPCQYAEAEGAQMGNRLRELGLVRLRRKGHKRPVWYLAEQGPPGRSSGAQSDDIGF